MEAPSVHHQISCPESISWVNSDRNVLGDAAGSSPQGGVSFYADEILTNEVKSKPEGKKLAKKRSRKRVSELFTRRIKRSAVDVHIDNGAVNEGSPPPDEILPPLPHRFQSMPLK
jgi:hypothetical protein